MKYCTVVDVENYLLTEVLADFEPQVEAWIEGVSLMTDVMANRILVAPPVGSGEDYPVRYYDGNDDNEIIIDDAVEIVSVEVDDEEVDDAVAYPKAPPHRKLIRTAGFPAGEWGQNIKVTGRFGYFDGIPDDIRLACAVFVAGIINASYKKQTKTSERIGNYSVTYADPKGFSDFENAKAVVERYRRIVF